ncbi:hypothetical protein GCM10017607_11790 [Microbacterium thalassium]|nr:hypothetical protein GCM10017607_11790 [Microbacterium thalassium]
MRPGGVPRGENEDEDDRGTDCDTRSSQTEAGIHTTAPARANAPANPTSTPTADPTDMSH